VSPACKQRFPALPAFAGRSIHRWCGG